MSDKGIGSLANVKPAQWKEMNAAFGSMTSFIGSGGFAAIEAAFTGPISRLKQLISNEVENAFEPLTSAISEFVDSIFKIVVDSGIMDQAATEFDKITEPVNNAVSWFQLLILWLNKLRNTTDDTTQAIKDQIAAKDEVRAEQMGQGTRINKIKQLEQGFIN